MDAKLTASVKFRDCHYHEFGLARNDSRTANAERRVRTRMGEKMKAGRNDPCPCGSGVKYKNCCLRKTEPAAAAIPSPGSKPMPAEPTAGECKQLVALFNAGDYAVVEQQAQMLLRRHPESGFVWLALGTSLKASGKDCLAALQRAATLLPNDADAQFNLAKSLKDLGHLDEAADAYRRVVRIKPDFAGAHNNLANTLCELGNPEEAEAGYGRALRIMPGYAEAHNGLGNACKQMGQLEEAAASYRRALEIKPDYAEAHVNLGNVLVDLVRPDQAAACYRRALQAVPDLADAHNGLGAACKLMGQMEEAEASFRRALLIMPEYAEALANLGILLFDVGRRQPGEALCREALRINPESAYVHDNLGRILHESNRLEEAEACYRKALALDPENADAQCNLGNVVANLGRPDEAIACYRRSFELRPDAAIPHSNYLFAVACAKDYSSRNFFPKARQWEKSVLTDNERDAASSRSFVRPARSGRRLRVGYVSGDFRQHAISHFIEPVLASHNRSRVETFAFSAFGREDEVSARLRGLVDHWQTIAFQNDEQTRQQIEGLEIDVLVDLSGHTAHNRLGIFARRAAPVQVHYLGFFASTGLSEMDYWIGDPVLLPQTEDPYYSERIWRLPRTWLAYPARADAPAVQWQPASDGSLLIGSFNQLRKTTDATLRLWAEILQALPEARLLLKTKDLNQISVRQRIEATMRNHGIATDRLELVGITPDWHSHMALYNRLDIALDPVGSQGGGTTTCEALWMGVPVITLLGEQMGERMTTSMLNAIGRLEWKAASESEYRDKVVALARDVDLRRSMRLAQRERMMSSSLCDVAGLVASLEDAYEQMFDRWRGPGIFAAGPACETPVAKRS